MNSASTFTWPARKYNHLQNVVLFFLFIITSFTGTGIKNTDEESGPFPGAQGVSARRRETAGVGMGFDARVFAHR